MTTGSEWTIQSKYPSSTGGLTDWHHYGTPFNEDDGQKRVRNLRLDFAEIQPDREFRLLRREVTIIYTDWEEVAV